MRPSRWAPADFAALLAAPDAFTQLGALRDVACIVVETSTLGHLPILPASLPVVVIGMGAPVAVCDLAVADDSEAATVIDAVHANPHAATVLVQLLRLQSSLSPHDALAAESLAYATLQGGREFATWLDARGSRMRKPAATPRVRVTHTSDGSRAVITLDRPRLFNLYDAAMRDALVETFGALIRDESVTRIELRGAGAAFCAGGDPAEFGTTRDTALAHLIRSSANLAPLLLVAAPRLHTFVHGAAVGAGCELAAFARSVTATGDAKFSLPEVSMGLVPGAGGTVSVTARIGRHRTAWVAITGATVDADTALRWGLVDQVEPGGPRAAR